MIKPGARLISVLAVLCFLLVGLSQPYAAAAAVEIIEPSVEYSFGGQMVFHAWVRASEPLQEVVVFFRSSGDPLTRLGAAEIGPEGEVEYVHDLSLEPLRVFSTVHYWFQVTLQNEPPYTSPEYSFEYEDNRFEWQVLSSTPFTVHWYDGDLTFAQSVLDVAHQGLQRANTFIPVQAPSAVNIYVYSSAADLQATLRLARWDWVAGHADPDLALMVVSLPKGPERRMETERQVPHELMHILLYEKVGNGYPQIPAWLNEGLASINETYPVPEYTMLIENALQEGSLLPINSLCHRFAPDASTITLSYAEAQSFTRYLYRQYGSSRLEILLSNFTEGIDCERGFQLVYEKTLEEMENDWLASTYPGSNQQEAAAGAVGEIWPWLGLMGVVVVLPLGAGLSMVWKGRAGRSTEERRLSSRGTPGD